MLGILNPPWGRTQPPPGAQINYAHPLAMGLLYYWPLNEGMGTPCKCYGIAGQKFNAAFNFDTGGVLPTWTTGLKGKAVNFTQVTGKSMVNCGAGANAASIRGLTAYSLAASFQAASLPVSGDTNQNTGARSIYWESKNATFAVRARILLSNNNVNYGGLVNSITFRWRNDDAGAATNLSAGGISVGTWYRVFVTSDSNLGQVFLYLNGVPVASFSGTMVPVSNTQTGDPVEIGDGANSEWFDGNINDVRVYNRAVTPSEVMADFVKPYDLWTAPNRKVVYYFPPPPPDTPPLHTREREQTFYPLPELESYYYVIPRWEGMSAAMLASLDVPPLHTREKEQIFYPLPEYDSYYYTFPRWEGMGPTNMPGQDPPPTHTREKEQIAAWIPLPEYDSWYWTFPRWEYGLSTAIMPAQQPPPTHTREKEQWFYPLPEFESWWLRPPSRIPTPGGVHTIPGQQPPPTRQAITFVPPEPPWAAQNYQRIYKLLFPDKPTARPNFNIARYYDEPPSTLAYDYLKKVRVQIPTIAPDVALRRPDIPFFPLPEVWHNPIWYLRTAFLHGIPALVFTLEQKGKYRIQDPTQDLYLIYMGENAPPDLSVVPYLSSPTLPFSFPIPSLPPKGTRIFMAPAPGSTDLPNLFTNPAQWATARDSLDVLELSYLSLWNGAPPPGPGNNTWTTLNTAGMISKLNTWGIKLCFYSGVWKPQYCSDTGAVQAVSDAKQAVDNVFGAGLTQVLIAIDEGFYGANASCGITSLTTQATRMNQFVSGITSPYTAGAVKVGLIEPYPSLSVAQIEAAVGALTTAPAFVHIDANWELINQTDAGKAAFYADMLTLKAYFAGLSIPFGIIFWPDIEPCPTNQIYYDRTFQFLNQVGNNIGMLPDSIYMSWVFSDVALTQKGIPTNLPDTDVTSMTGIVRRGVGARSSTTFYFVIRKQDSYGLVSQNQQATTITVDPTGSVVLPPMAAPTEVKVFYLGEGQIRVTAIYPTVKTDPYPADKWRVWTTLDPALPDTTTVPQAIVNVKGPHLATVLNGYTPGIYNVLVALYRTADGTLSPGVTVQVIVPPVPAQPGSVHGGHELGW